MGIYLTDERDISGASLSRNLILKTQQEILGVPTLLTRGFLIVVYFIDPNHVLY